MHACMCVCVCALHCPLHQLLQTILLSALPIQISPRSGLDRRALCHAIPVDSAQHQTSDCHTPKQSLVAITAAYDMMPWFRLPTGDKHDPPEKISRISGAKQQLEREIDSTPQQHCTYQHDALCSY